MNEYHYEVGDIVKLKKPHPCGSNEWEILRVGADFRLKWLRCVVINGDQQKHYVMKSLIDLNYSLLT